MRALRHRVGRGGFTLIELLAVMGIMLLIMGIIVSSSFTVGRGQRLRGGVESLRNSLALARQYAITQNMEVTVDFYAPQPPSLDTHMFTLRARDLYGDGNEFAMRDATYLPNGVKMKFDVESQPGIDVDAPELVFKPNGQITWSGGDEPKVWLYETVSDDSDDLVLVEIYALTGVIHVEWINSE